MALRAGPISALVLALLGTTLLSVACDGTRERQSSTNPRDIGPRVDGSVDAGSVSDASSTGDGATGFDTLPPPEDGGTGDGGLPPPPDGGSGGDAGCLTFEQASNLCGFNSGGQICNFAVSCSLSTSQSQCQINCEMGATVSCYTTATALCVANAYQAENCAVLATCGVVW